LWKVFGMNDSFVFRLTRMYQEGIYIDKAYRMLLRLVQ
jgi:hypothetical protein